MLIGKPILPESTSAEYESVGALIICTRICSNAGLGVWMVIKLSGLSKLSSMNAWWVALMNFFWALLWSRLGLEM